MQKKIPVPLYGSSHSDRDHPNSSFDTIQRLFHSIRYITYFVISPCLCPHQHHIVRPLWVDSSIYNGLCFSESSVKAGQWVSRSLLRLWALIRSYCQIVNIVNIVNDLPPLAGMMVHLHHTSADFEAFLLLSLPFCHARNSWVLSCFVFQPFRLLHTYKGGQSRCVYIIHSCRSSTWCLSTLCSRLICSQATRLETLHSHDFSPSWHCLTLVWRSFPGGVHRRNPRYQLSSYLIGAWGPTLI